MRIFPLNQEPLYYLVQETLLQDSLKVNPFSVRKKEGERKKKKKHFCWENVVLFSLIH